jgi:hypothetical protein
VFWWGIPLVDTFYTWCLWLGAFSYASLSVLVWAVPNHFQEFSDPTQPSMKRRQVFWSAIAAAFAAFCVWYALTQYPHLNRPVAQVLTVGLTSCTVGMAAILGWMRLVRQILRRARPRAQSDPTSPSSSYAPNRTDV